MESVGRVKRGISRTRPRTSVLLFKATKKEHNFARVRISSNRFPSRKGARNPLRALKDRSRSPFLDRKIRRRGGKNYRELAVTISRDSRSLLLHSIVRFLSDQVPMVNRLGRRAAPSRKSIEPTRTVRNEIDHR